MRTVRRQKVIDSIQQNVFDSSFWAVGTVLAAIAHQGGRRASMMLAYVSAFS